MGTNEGHRVLIVDDALEARELASIALTRAGFTVDDAASATEALARIGARRPDLVVLDVGLPGMDGLDLLTDLRRTSDLPVILVTGRSEESDRIVGLELGADDYVVKPFSPRELVARVKAVLRRTEGPRPEGELIFGELSIDPATREVRKGPDVVVTTAREFDLLCFMARSPRRVFTREQLLQTVWESSSEWQDPRTVTEHVRRLRLKLEDDPAEPRWITSVRGVGYRFQP